MGTLSATAKNTAVDAVTATVGYIGLLDASGNEIAGGSPAYARKAASWDAADGGVADIAASVVFDVPASTTVASVAGYAADTGGAALFTDAVVNETFGGQGTYTLTACPVTVADPA